MTVPLVLRAMGVALCSSISPNASQAATLPPLVTTTALNALAEDLLYPDKAKVRGIGGNIDKAGVITVCGFVFPMRGDGVRGDQRAFIVRLLGGEKHTSLIAKDVGDDGDLILALCAQGGVTELSYQGDDNDIPVLISNYFN